MFIQALITDPKLNQRQAYYAAGYRAKSDHAAEQGASKVLRKPKVRAAYEYVLAERAQRTGINADRVLLELEAMAFSNVEHYELDPETGRVTLADGAPHHAMRAVASIKRRKFVRGFGKNQEVTYEVEMRLWDKSGNLKLAGKHVGLFADRLELTGKSGKPIEVEAIQSMSDDELYAKLEELLAKRRKAS